jgi:hypothetical protein
MSRFILVLVGAAGLALSACNGSEGPDDASRLSKAEYEDRMDQIRDELEPLSDDANAAIEEGDAEKALDLLAKGTAQLVDELESIEPPLEVAQAHEDFATSLTTLLGHWRATADVTRDRGFRQGMEFFVREIPQESLRLNQRAQRVFEREGYQFGNLQPALSGQDAE